MSKPIYILVHRNVVVRAYEDKLLAEKEAHQENEKAVAGGARPEHRVATTTLITQRRG